MLTWIPRLIPLFADNMAVTQPSPRSLLRTITERGVWVLLIFIILQTWLLDGLIAPCWVVGGSMAPALLGEHHNVVCANCGFPYACDADVQPDNPQSVCPNCGHPNNIEMLPQLSGDRVLINRAAYNFRRPARWEVVAFRHPQAAEKILIKRVVGLPGESVQIVGGDVYINGQIERKTLDQQLAMIVPVYDANYLPTIEPAPPPRWRGETESSCWKRNKGQFSHSYTTDNLNNATNPSPSIQTEKTIDWLEYHNSRRTPGTPDGVEEFPITDITAYNHSLPRRAENVHATNDLMLAFRLTKIAGQGKFLIRSHRRQ